MGTKNIKYIFALVFHWDSRGREDRNEFILHNQYHNHWCTCYMRGHGNNSHNIELVILEYTYFNAIRVKMFTNLISRTIQIMKYRELQLNDWLQNWHASNVCSTYTYWEGLGLLYHVYTGINVYLETCSGKNAFCHVLVNIGPFRDCSHLKFFICCSMFEHKNEYLLIEYNFFVLDSKKYHKFEFLAKNYGT